jgi:hypothetical protein
LCQGVFEFVGAIRGIDVHENPADFGSRELSNDPFKAVGCPDSHAISLLNSKAQEGTCELLGRVPKFCVREAAVLVATHKGGCIRIDARSAVKNLSDAIA